MIIFVKIPISVCPSILAASTIDVGTESKKFLNSIMLNAENDAIIHSGIKLPVMLIPRIGKFTNSEYSGIIFIDVGKSIVKNTSL